MTISDFLQKYKIVMYPNFDLYIYIFFFFFFFFTLPPILHLTPAHEELLHIPAYEKFVFVTEASTVQQNDSDRTEQKNQITKRRIKK